MGQGEREKRLKEALRANLRRRKDQARGRGAGTGEATPAKAEEPKSSAPEGRDPAPDTI